MCTNQDEETNQPIVNVPDIKELIDGVETSEN